jgi:hypothetical protein
MTRASEDRRAAWYVTSGIRLVRRYWVASIDPDLDWRGH